METLVSLLVHPPGPPNTQSSRLLKPKNSSVSCSNQGILRVLVVLRYSHTGSWMLQLPTGWYHLLTHPWMLRLPAGLHHLLTHSWTLWLPAGLHHLLAHSWLLRLPVGLHHYIVLIELMLCDPSWTGALTHPDWASLLLTPIVATTHFLLIQFTFMDNPHSNN